MQMSMFSWKGWKKERALMSDIERTICDSCEAMTSTSEPSTCPVLRLDTSEIDFVGQQQHYEALLEVLETEH